MSPMPSFSRTRLAVALAALVLSAPGCSWIKSKFHSEPPYRDSQLAQPLEVPPGLDMPQPNSSFEIPAVAAAGQGSPTSAASVDAFVVEDSAESAWRRVGLALGRVDGVTRSGQAELLKSYQVSYQGQAMLIRVEAQGEAQARVSALASDGSELQGGAAAQLLGLLKARLN